MKYYKVYQYADPNQGYGDAGSLHFFEALDIFEAKAIAKGKGYSTYSCGVVEVSGQAMVAELEAIQKEVNRLVTLVGSIVSIL